MAHVLTVSSTRQIRVSVFAATGRREYTAADNTTKTKHSI